MQTDCLTLQVENRKRKIKEIKLLTKYLNTMKKIYFLFLFALIASMSGLQAAEEILLYETGFESSEEFKASTTYNNKVVVLFGPANQRWGTICGTVATNSAITDKQSMQMRYYESVKLTPYVYMDFDLQNVSKVVYKAKTVDARNNTLLVQHSTDGGDTWSEGESISLTTSATEFTYVVAGENSNVRFKFTATNTPVEKKGIVIDDVRIYGEAVTELTAPVITGVVNGKTYYGSASVSISYPALATSMTYTITKDGEAGEPVTVTSAVADLVIDEAGSYKVEATAFGEGDTQVEATPVEFTVAANTEVASVADFLDKASKSENTDEIYEFTCPLTVAYQYDADIYVRDAEGGALLIYDMRRTYEGKYSMGDVIPAGATGKYEEYEGTYELVEATLGDATETAAIEPVEMAVNAITAADQSKYVVLKGVTINDNKFVDADGNEIAYYNSFEVEIPTEVANYNVTGIVELYKNNAQISPIAFEVAEVTKCAAPVFSLAEGTYNEAQTLTITSTEGSTIVYSINDGELVEAASPATVTLEAAASAVTYTIEAYATMEGADDSDVVTKTYTIDPNEVLPLVVKISEVADENGWVASVSGAGEKYISFTKDGFDFTINATDQNSGKYYSNSDGESWRVYKGASLTISAPASVEITGVEFVTGKWNCSGVNTGSLNGKVWTATEENTQSVTFTMDGTSEIMEMYISYEAIPAGVEGVEAAEAAISANADGVVVVAEGAVAEVYNAAGQLVAAEAVNGESVIAVPAGFYIVRVGNATAKVVVK